MASLLHRAKHAVGLRVPGPDEPAEPEWASDSECQENARFLLTRLRTQPALRSTLLVVVAISSTRKVLCYVRARDAQGAVVVEPYFAWRQNAAGVVVSHTEQPLQRTDKICFEPTKGLVRKKLEMMTNVLPDGGVEMAMAQLPRVVFRLRAAHRVLPNGIKEPFHGITMPVAAPDAAHDAPPTPMLVEDIFVRVKPGMQPTAKEAFAYLLFRVNAGRVLPHSGKRTLETKYSL